MIACPFSDGDIKAWAGSFVVASGAGGRKVPRIGGRMAAAAPGKRAKNSEGKGEFTERPLHNEGVTAQPPCEELPYPLGQNDARRR